MKRKIYREDILDAGQELMFLNGYGSTGIKDITDEVDIPKGSFYNHFSSKEEFGLEMLQRYCDRGLAWHRRTLLENKEGTPLERLETLYASSIEGYEARMEHKYGCIMSNFSAEMADVNEAFREVLDKEFNEIQSIIEECLNQAIEEGELNIKTDTKEMAHFILNSWHGALVRMKSTGDIAPLNTFKDNIFSMLKR